MMMGARAVGVAMLMRVTRSMVMPVVLVIMVIMVIVIVVFVSHGTALIPLCILYREYSVGAWPKAI